MGHTLLSQRHTLLVDMRVTVIGFDDLPALYTDNPFFSRIINTLTTNADNPYVRLDGFLFYKNRLCIPESSLRLCLIT